MENGEYIICQFEGGAKKKRKTKAKAPAKRSKSKTRNYKVNTAYCGSCGDFTESINKVTKNNIESSNCKKCNNTRSMYGM